MCQAQREQFAIFLTIEDFYPLSKGSVGAQVARKQALLQASRRVRSNAKDQRFAIIGAQSKRINL